MRGDGEHSYGHGSHCYWCGVDGDSPEADKPCDERENQKPSEEEMAAYNARQELGEQISTIGFEYGLQIIEWDEAMARIKKLTPLEIRSTGEDTKGTEV